MAITHVTDGTLKTAVSNNDLVLVDFWAPWCGPCRMIAPVLDELDAEAGGKVQIVKLNVDDNQQSAREHGVMSIPTLKLFKGGREIDTLVGFRGKEQLKQWVFQYT